ncbi:hypothetical protein [Parvibaculum sp.]|uniref:hypothetical protein n=1 Tax=Parvibaculum sp. TaxID=2024848 RepID=UPI001B15D6E1|nr:hypothetical protein [Parvibaculum sp.]MBO6668032.1 hypothetical protein [Parvibaculum sp.]MBO6715652.1 hypothetical protein [Parvibaculum sp.]
MGKAGVVQKFSVIVLALFALLFYFMPWFEVTTRVLFVTHTETKSAFDLWEAAQQRCEVSSCPDEAVYFQIAAAYPLFVAVATFLALVNAVTLARIVAGLSVLGCAAVFLLIYTSTSQNGYDIKWGAYVALLAVVIFAQGVVALGVARRQRKSAERGPPGVEGGKPQVQSQKASDRDRIGTHENPVSHARSGAAIPLSGYAYIALVIPCLLFNWIYFEPYLGFELLALMLAASFIGIGAILVGRARSGA